MDSVVPKEVDFTKPRELPPSTRCSSLVSIPQQGISSFTEGTQCTFPLVSYGFVVPSSLVVSFNIVATKATGSTTTILGGGWAPISRLDTQIQSNTIETINNYNQLYGMLINSKMDVAAKQGLSLMLNAGVVEGTGADFTNSDGYTIASGTTAVNVRVSLPLGCAISCSDKLFPSMPDTRITLTLDSLANMYNGAALSNFSLQNVQLNYDVVRFDSVTDALILNSQVDANGDLFLKSQSYVVSSQPIATGSVGYIEIPYANSLTSIKSLYTLFSASVGPRWSASYDIFDSFDALGGGQLSYTIAGAPFPETSIDLKNRPQYSLAEFLGAIYGTKDAMISATTCLSRASFKPADANLADDSPIINVPKAYFGCNVERLSGSHTLLSGISSMNSNLTLRLNINKATLSQLNAVTIIAFDLVFKYNPATRQVVVMK